MRAADEIIFDNQKNLEKKSKQTSVVDDHPATFL